ncbi:MAG: DUF2059 domain-containing protein [Thermodesulfobacteriota bacterium]|nr:DUF2059 domain-containing protein [Thermodesulfobacteriota bacterium]
MTDYRRGKRIFDCLGGGSGMKERIGWVIFTLLLLGVMPSCGNDAERKMAAQRYLDATGPVSIGVRQTLAMCPPFVSLRPEKREAQIDATMALIGGKELDCKVMELLVKYFSAEELDAMAEFYGSPVGRGIMEKFPLYMADVFKWITAKDQEFKRLIGIGNSAATE